MAYGTIKVDTVTFTDAGIDKSVTLSGLVQNPTFSGNVTVTGTLSGVTVTGTTANFTSGNFTNISGGTHTITSGVFAAGSAASPSITFTGDLNTGIYSPGADQVAISTGGSGRLFVDANGNVGLGTSSPANFAGFVTLALADSSGAEVDFIKGSTVQGALYNASDIFYIESKSTVPTAFVTNGAERLRITSAGLVGIGTSTPGDTLTVGSGSGYHGIQIFTGSANTGELRFSDTGGGSYQGAVAYNHSTNALQLLTNGSNVALTVDSSQQVGIGSTTPRALLDIGGNVAFSAGTYQSPKLAVSNGYIGIKSDAADGVSRLTLIGDSSTGDGTIDWGGNIASALKFSNNGSERARIDSSGRFLVGTSSARTTTLFGSGAGYQALIEKGGTYAGLMLYGNINSTQGSYIGLGKSRGNTAGSFTIVQNGDTLGYLGFEGADGSSSLLAAIISAEVDGTPGANDMPGRLVFSTTADGASSPTERLIIKESGDIVIPSTSATKGLWFGTGDADGNNASASYRIGQNSTGIGSATLYIGNAAIQVSSDARLKKNIQDTTLSAVEELQKVRVVDFTWNDPSDTSYNNRNARGTWTGVIAQEIVDVFPFAVNAPRKENDLLIDHDSDSTWTVEQQQLVPVLIKAIQEQQVVIADLQSRVAVLEAQ